MMGISSYTYKCKLWTQCTTTSDSNSFFHSAFGTKANENDPFHDKQAKFRRMRWAAFLIYFENQNMPSCLADILRNCFSANDKYKCLTIDSKPDFEQYVSDIMGAERFITKEDIPILATLENVKVVILSYNNSDPLMIVNPNPDILGNYQNVSGKLKEVVICLEGNTFSRTEPINEISLPKSNGNEVSRKTNPGKYKKGGSAGSKGIEYQVSLLALVILNTLKNTLSEWKLSTENEEAGKFDDIVLEWSQGTVLIQSKHKENYKKKITLEELTSTNSKHDDFSLPKYFLWYQIVKTKFNVKHVIICTNAGVHENVLKFLIRQKANSESMLHYEDNDCLFYILNDKILPDLKEKTISYYQKNFQSKGIEESAITDDNLKDFVKQLQLYFSYPNIDYIEKVIEKSLSFTNCCNNWLDKVTPSEIFSKVMNWFQQKEGVYFTEIYAKAMFSEIRRDKFCRKLDHYGMFFQRNDWNFQGPTQIFYIPTKERYLLQLIKVHLTLCDNRAKLFYVNFDDGIDIQKQVLESFKLPHYVFLIIICLKTSEEFISSEEFGKLKDLLQRYKYKKIILIADDPKLVHLVGLENVVHLDGSVTFNDLSTISQNKLIRENNIIFQGKRFSLKELLPANAIEDYGKAINGKILEKLIKKEEVKIGSPLSDLDDKMRLYYICRTFTRTFINLQDEKSNSVKADDLKNEENAKLYQKQEFKEESTENIDGMWNVRNKEETFFESNIFDVNEKLVFISDGAGMGKSTVLFKLASTIKEIHPHLWVIKITLNDFTRILGDALNNGRDTISIIELLESKEEIELQNHLERYIFSANQKVVLMLDGIDEISPDYTGLVLSMIKQCQEQSNFAKIFITTRPHVTKDLERLLKEKPFILKPFTEQNQIDFLTSYWIHNLELKENIHKEKCKRYAKQLINSISWKNLDNNTDNHFASIPLHVRMAAEIFQDSIGEESEPNLINKINVTELYDLFFNKKWNIFCQKENPDRKIWTNQELIKKINDYRMYHRSLALELIVHEDNLCYFPSYQKCNTYMETSLLKIGIVQKFNDKFNFIHRTFADYFLAENLILELQHNQMLEFHIFLIDVIFIGPQYNIIRMFFDSFLRKIVHTLPFNIFEKYQFTNQECTWKLFMLKSTLIHILAGEGCVAILQLILKYLNVKIIKNNKIAVTNFYKTDFNKDGQRSLFGNTLNFLQYVVGQFGINIKDENGQTPLHRAALNGHTDMVKFLTAQTSVDSQSNNDVATGLCESNTIRKLVELPVDVNIKDNYGYTALHLAACFGQLDAMKYLVDYGLDINVTNNNNRTLLHSASANGHLEIVKYLLALDVDFRIKDNGGNTPLQLAICFGHLETAKLLIDYGADLKVINNDKRTLLHSASANGHLDTVKFLLEFGVDPNITDDYGNSCLHLAVCFGHLETVIFLVENGLDFRYKNSCGQTLLHSAGANGHLETLRYVLDLGVDFNIRGNDGNTVLHLAIYYGHLNIVKFLVECGMDFNVVANHGRTPLHLASVKGNLDVVKFFLQLGLNFNAKDDDGYTALNFATCFGQLNIVKYLVNLTESSAKLFLKYGDFNITNSMGHTVLHSASAKGHLKLVKYFLKLGRPFIIKDNEGYTALHLAARFGHLTIVKYLVEYGMDFNAKNHNDRTLLHSASAAGHLEMVKVLLNLGVDIEARDNNGNTALHLAICFGHLAIVIFFAKNGVNINVTDNNDRTLLHIAAANGHVEIVSFLLQRGADLKTIDAHGNTALHLAACFCHLDTVKFFVENGLDVNITGNRGRTPLLLSCANGRLDTVEFLLKLGGDIQIRDIYGNTALHLASRFGQLNIVKFLVAYGLDYNATSKHGRTPIHLASENGQLDTVKFLLQLGVDFKTRDHYGNMALHLAAGFGHLDILKLLLEYGLHFDIRGSNGRTPLHLASANGHLETVKFLLERGANFKIRNKDGLMPLQLAVRNGQSDTAKFLREYIANINGNNLKSCRLM